MQEDLWEFALAVYARPGVEGACLRLQEAGADVCLVLAALWLDCRACALDAKGLERLRAAANLWQETVVRPLRQLRQAWKAPADEDEDLAALRERLKTLELAAEREQLARLAHLAAHWPCRTTNDRRTWLEAVAPQAATATDLGLLTEAARAVRP
ncbi:TIGR02444 family protein [Pseudomonas oryzihabitans]|uniref:TIGR02444 family protein n=1 Tax=Pseudomonas oryzihabitans TaxID=47885 RepID=UPI0028947565|nr:TIGR02444 family protein [Pseudomonas oryzihabitans]MDT3721118.1 TIGR02444 family protein [Pseudomonas oryzihabitans]